MITHPEMVLSQIESGILLTLLYFDIFRYPLTEEEIGKSIPVVCTKENIATALAQLGEAKLIIQEDTFYHIGTAGVTKKRKEDNARAEAIMEKAHKISRFIGSFPYIRGVYLSGSISKGVLTDKGDIDYFILTEPNRLWIARTILVFFRKIFLLNSHKYFCVNYFVGMEHLEIEDKNIFTATELFTLIPAYGKDTYPALMEKNEWARAFYPQFPIKDTLAVPKSGKSLLKSIIERVGNSFLGELIDNWCMRMTFRYRKKKFEGMSNADFNIAFKTRKNISKHHPSHFQKRVINALKEKTNTFEALHHVNLAEDIKSIWNV